MKYGRKFFKPDISILKLLILCQSIMINLTYVGGVVTREEILYLYLGIAQTLTVLANTVKKC